MGRESPGPPPRGGRSLSEAAGDIQVTLRPAAPRPQALTEAAARAAAALAELLGGDRHRLLSIRLVEGGARGKPARRGPPRGYQATAFDYTNNRCVVLEGSLAGSAPPSVLYSGRQPRPSAEEFQEAVRVLEGDGELGAEVTAGALRPYRPMPPLVALDSPEGRPARVIAVGLLGEGERPSHEIVGVNLLDRSIVRFPAGAPPGARAHDGVCGAPNAAQETISASPGQVWVTVSQAGSVVWRFLAVRPAASSGTNGSGVELRFVDYRGRRVLYRAHVPILNVKYDGDACGPYRDWQDQEGALGAPGADVAPGFRLCPAPASTILESGSDVGDFVGVAVYVEGQELVLVSEMEAGWYRYVSQWRLHTDGTIAARFGFSAVASSCVCTRHHHHAYWRLDFDIETAGDNVVQEFNDPPLGASPWHDKAYEIRRMRDPARQRRWRVANATSGRAYDVVPGPDDGVATAFPDWPFPRGDVWILRYRGTELDDGVVATGPPYEAGLDALAGQAEPIHRADVVIWYGAHFTHDPANEPPGGVHGHTVGPDLKPVNW